MKLDHRLYNIDKSPRLYNYLLRKMQSYPFDWNWDSFTVTNTAATTLIVILFSASCTRSFLLRILCAPRSFLYSLGRRREKQDVSSPREEKEEEEEEEENEVEEEEEEEEDEDGLHVWQDEGGNRIFLRRLRYMMQERLPYIPDILSLTFGRIQKISGRLMLDVEGEDDAFQTSHKKNKGNNNFYNNKNIGRLGQVAGISEGGNVASRGQLPNIALPPPPAISEGIGGMTDNDVHYHSESKKSKLVSFDPNIEPAFLNDNDYPDDWMVYDPMQGKIVSRKELKVEPRLKPQAIHAQ